MRRMMRELAILVPAVALIGLRAAPALAGSELPPPNEPQVGDVILQPGAGPGSLVFTGANVSVWMVVVAALLLIGIAFLFVGRRHRLNASH